MAKPKEDPQSPFPSDFVPASKKKQKAWILQAAKAAHDAEYGRFMGNFDSNRNKYRMLRDYAQGKYDNARFINLVSGKGNKTFAQLDLQVSTPLPVVRESLVGQFENQGLKPRVKCLSPESKTQYDQKLRELKANRLLAQKAPQLKKVGINPKPKGTKIIIEDDEEMELWMETDFKDDYTSAMQAAIDFVLEAQNIDYFKRKIYDDLVVCAKACLRVSFDQNHDIRIRYVDIENHGSDYVKEDNYSDAKYQFEYKEYTIDELAELSETSFTEEELFEIARDVANRDGNTWDTHWGDRYNYNKNNPSRPWGRFKVSVLDLEYKSTDPVRYEKVPNKKGGGFYFDKIVNKPKNENNEVVSKRITNIYQGQWVVGTDYLFSFGMKENMTRERINGCYSGDTDFSFVTFAPDLRGMQNKSIIEKLVGLADQYVLTCLKAQTIVAKARVQGIKLNVTALAPITNGLGIQNLKPLELVEMMEQTSTYYTASITEDGTLMPNMDAVTETPESRMLGLQSLAVREQAILKAMEYATGVPLGTIGAPDSDSLVGLQKIAAENRNNATRYITTAYKSILSRTCKITSLMVQDAIGGEAKKIDDFGMAIGYPAAKMLEFTKNLTAVQFGIFVDVLPDAVEQQEFIDGLNAAVAAGQIKQSQKMMLARKGREQPELAERIMRVYEKKNAQEQAQMQAAVPRAQAEAQAMQAQAAEAAKQKTLQVEYQLKAEYLKLEYQLKYKQSAQDHNEKAKEIVIQGDIDIEKIEKATEESEKVNEGKDLRDVSSPSGVEPRVFPSRVGRMDMAK